MKTFIYICNKKLLHFTLQTEIHKICFSCGELGHRLSEKEHCYDLGYCNIFSFLFVPFFHFLLVFSSADYSFHSPSMAISDHLLACNKKKMSGQNFICTAVC